MNSTATRKESRSVIDDVRGEFSCVGDGRRADARSPWPEGGGLRSKISPPRRRRKGLRHQTASATLGGLMNSTATRKEFGGLYKYEKIQQGNELLIVSEIYTSADN